MFPVDLDIAHMFRQILFEASFEASSFEFTSANDGGVTLASKVAHFYVSLMDNADLLFSVMGDAFMRKSPAPSSSSRQAVPPVAFEDYLDKGEVKALSLLVGLHGIRLIDESLVQCAVPHITSMQVYLCLWPIPSVFCGCIVGGSQSLNYISPSCTLFFSCSAGSAPEKQKGAHGAERAGCHERLGEVEVHCRQH